jgi:hypothetical protein
MNELLPSVQAVLETTAPRWLSLATMIPPDVLHHSTPPGEWSAVECLRHLSDAERDVFPVRVRDFLAGQNLTPYDPVAQGSGDAGETPLALAEDFAPLRGESGSPGAGATRRPQSGSHSWRVRPGSSHRAVARMGGARPDAYRPGRTSPHAALRGGQRTLATELCRPRRC